MIKKINIKFLYKKIFFIFLVFFSNLFFVNYSYWENILNNDLFIKKHNLDLEKQREIYEEVILQRKKVKKTKQKKYLNKFDTFLWSLSEKKLQIFEKKVGKLIWNKEYNKKYWEIFYYLKLKVKQNLFRKKLEKLYNYNWYFIKKQYKGINLLSNEDETLFILDIDLNYANINFWWINIDEDISDLRKYSRENILEMQKKLKNTNFKNNEIFALINWQFFDPFQNPSSLSFPLKSNYKVINSYIDNKFSKKTFLIDKNKNAKILDNFDLKKLYDKKNKELIVWFNPNVNMKSSKKIWRTYIWIKWKKNIIFFIAKNKTQKFMDIMMKRYGIDEKNIIMMDWWSSSQFAFLKKYNSWKYLWKKYYSNWKIPHYFVVYK